MPLTYHHTVDGVSTFATDSAAVTQSKLNANFGVCVADAQGCEDRAEDTWYDAKGSGILKGLQPSVPVSGLTVTVAAGVALIGRSVSVGAANVPVTASCDPGYLYLCQDGTFHDAGATATPPSGESSVLYATYTTDGYDTQTVTLVASGIEFGRIEANVNGAVSAGVIKTTLLERDIFIEQVSIVLGNSGSYASTIVDVHVGAAGSTPASIFTDQNQRPALASGVAVYSVDESGVPDTNRTAEEGMVLLIEVDAVATGAQDLGVVVAFRYCDKVV